MERQRNAVAPKRLENLVVSIAVAFEALLLHGETRPMTHPQPEHPAHFLSSDPAQAHRDECRYGKSLNAPMAQDAEELRWYRQIAVSGQTRMQRVSCRIRVSLPAMPAPILIKRKTSVTQCRGEAG